MPAIIDGTNGLFLEGTNSTVGQVKLYEDTDNGTNYIELKAPTSIASNVSLTLPDADGTTGQALTTNGSGTLSFTSIVGGAQGFVTQLNGGNVAPTQNADSAALI